MSSFIKTGLIGHPVAHSKSPLIHGHWIKKYGLSGSYTAIDVAGDVEKTVRQLMAEGFQGLNVTLPHKETVLRLCDEVDETAQAVGAVNTLVMKNGKISGKNTDVFGFVESVKESTRGFDFKKGPGFVLGAGGAARGILQGLIEQGVPEIYLSNRTREKAEELARAFKNIKIIDWDKRSDILNQANLLVNTTSLGLKGQPPLEINLEKLNLAAVVCDIVYLPHETDLLKAAKARGNVIVPGIGMLLHQARLAFKEWFGVLPEIDEELKRLVA
jgi:shikimate dehydrogenase